MTTEDNEPDDDFDDDIETDDYDCPWCSGALMLLGRLGNITYYRCRCCGAETPIQ